jgi:hypothetical protein
MNEVCPLGIGAKQICSRPAAAFKKLCTVTADTSELAKTLSPRSSQWGTVYTLDYSIILRFGLTELKAYVSWEEHVRVFKVIS